MLLPTGRECAVSRYTHISSVHVTAHFFLCKLTNGILALRRKKRVGRKEKDISLAEKRESSQRRKSKVKGGIFLIFFLRMANICPIFWPCSAENWRRQILGFNHDGWFLGWGYLKDTIGGRSACWDSS